MKAVRIPVDQTAPIDIIEVGKDWRSLAAAIGGPCEYIERAYCPLSYEYNLVFVVDENGRYNGQLANPRAWPLYPVPECDLHGTVLVVAEYRTGEEIDFVDLPDPERALKVVKGLIGQ